MSESFTYNPRPMAKSIAEEIDWMIKEGISFSPSVPTTGTATAAKRWSRPRLKRSPTA